MDQLFCVWVVHCVCAIVCVCVVPTHHRFRLIAKHTLTHTQTLRKRAPWVRVLICRKVNSMFMTLLILCIYVSARSRPSLYRTPHRVCDGVRKVSFAYKLIWGGLFHHTARLLLLLLLLLSLSVLRSERTLWCH